jgi:hypothetical protein
MRVILTEIMWSQKENQYVQSHGGSTPSDRRTFDVNSQNLEVLDSLSYPVFMPKPSTHRMHDPGSIVPHIRSKVFTDDQIS